MTAPALDMPGAPLEEDGDARRIADAYRERQARQLVKNIRVVAWSIPVAAAVMAVASGSGYDIFGGLLFATALAAYARLLRRHRALTGRWRFY
ncbi:hypothetical protein [Azospirillum sp. ST 5-10]|uniref:hypothetical protein n=1 Tax=unclassified Azospirillum TaxID=2630922 RepID=UPI003F4A397D